jgi:hypothetical protein
MSKMRKNIGIYKANKNKTGSVAQFKLAQDGSCMFLEMARQVNEMDNPRPYDWDNKIIVKLGLPDISKLMNFFRRNVGKDHKLDLFHSSEKGSKSIKVEWQDKYNSFYLNVSFKDKDGGILRVGIPIGLDEVELLMAAFQRAVIIILAWD